MNYPKNYVPVVSADIVRRVVKDTYFSLRMPTWNIGIGEVYESNGNAVSIDSKFEFYSVDDIKDVITTKDLAELAVSAKIFYVSPMNLLTTN